jgi:hypothetical protein
MNRVSSRVISVLLLLVGGFAIHVAIVACSSVVDRDAGNGGATGERDANAQTVPGVTASALPCPKWEVKVLHPKALSRVEIVGAAVPAASFDTFALEDSWEPFGGDIGSIMVRRCAK